MGFVLKGPNPYALGDLEKTTLIECGNLKGQSWTYWNQETKMLTQPRGRERPIPTTTLQIPRSDSKWGGGFMPQREAFSTESKVVSSRATQSSGGRGSHSGNGWSPDVRASHGPPLGAISTPPQPHVIFSGEPNQRTHSQAQSNILPELGASHQLLGSAGRPVTTVE